MRVMRLIGLLFLWSCLIGSWMASQAWAEERPLAKSVDELIARYDSTSCRECHEEIYDQWANSLHAISAFGSGGGRTAATFVTAIEKGLMIMPYSGVKSPEDVQRKHMMGCAKCHLPQLAEASDEAVQEWIELVYAFMEDGDEDAEEKLMELNIGCMICHNRNAITHKWVDGFPEPGTIYGSKEGAHDDEAHPVLKKGPILKESILCGQCHGLGPNLELENPTQCATLYGSYIFAYIPEGGDKTCQYCHMEKTGMGHDIKAYSNETMIKAAIHAEVSAQTYYWRKNKESGVLPMGVVKVELLNKSGHTIPDG